MFKRFGALAMMLAGSLAVMTPAVAQARDRDDYRRYERHEDRRDWNRRDFSRGERREWRQEERFDRREYRPVYGYGYGNPYRPTYYDRFGNPYCPR